MNILAKKRLLIGTIIILIVINISALGTMAFHKYKYKKSIEFNDDNRNYQNDRRGNQRKAYHIRVKNFVKRELSLSDEQFEQYTNLKDVNIEKSQLLIKEIGNRKKLIFKEYCKESLDTVALNRMADEIGIFHTKVQKETLRHFQAVEEILTAEQLIKFKKMLCKMADRKGHGYYRNKKNRKKLMRGMDTEN